jgi:hypothetical protein
MGHPLRAAERMLIILQVTWTFDGGSPISQSLSDGYPAPQSISVPSVIAQTVTLTIDATTAPGQAGFDWTPISEVYLRGR